MESTQPNKKEITDCTPEVESASKSGCPKSGSGQASEHSREAGEKHKATEVSTDTLLDYEELAKLASSHRREFQRYGKIDDIEKAIECDNKALSLIPYDNSAIAGQLAKLGINYSERFKRTGEMKDLAKPTTTACQPGNGLL
ncbi:hypothetical protein RHS04_00937 [Rhizoctonia solani]|uniref:Uncharacterized protein n=1 Tax=Rhizoctonia solani TaxID=456999 RepID=A0A8H7LNP3_9AGAM|nr:hypothetical protein RHS04_00937 [Rhizoctonia solani]